MAGVSSQRTTGLVLGAIAGTALVGAVIVALVPFDAGCKGPTYAICAADAASLQGWLLVGLLALTVLGAAAAIVTLLMAPKKQESTAGPGWAEMTGASRPEARPDKTPEGGAADQAAVRDRGVRREGAARTRGGPTEGAVRDRGTERDQVRNAVPERSAVRDRRR